MPKLTEESRQKIAPLLLNMLKNGMTLRQIENTLSGLKPLTYQAIADILNRYFPLEYTRIINERDVKKKYEK